MKELKDIIRAYDRAAAAGKKTALATVVQVEGSSYRRPGARMLVTEDGEITGAISGGCLEGDALKKAQFAIFQGQNRLVVYDAMDEDDLKFGVQLGCNGIVTILFEPIIQEAGSPIALMRRVIGGRRESMLVTLVDHIHQQHPGTCGYMGEEEAIWHTANAPTQEKATTLFGEKTGAVEEENGLLALYQYLPPVIQLVIAGAGNDARPISEMAAVLGWEIIVADGRHTHAQPQRFPGADQVLVARAEDLVAQLEVDSRTAFVLLTHNYNYDLALLEQLLPTACPYIGVLGPKKKMSRMLDELVGRGITVSGAAEEKIYGPVGLDIGAETGEEIALSIIAEIKACFADRTGLSLRQKQGSIHQPTL